MLVKSHVKQVKSWVECKDFEICTPILGVSDPLCETKPELLNNSQLIWIESDSLKDSLDVNKQYNFDSCIMIYLKRSL